MVGKSNLSSLTFALIQNVYQFTSCEVYLFCCHCFINYKNAITMKRIIDTIVQDTMIGGWGVWLRGREHV